MRAFLALIDKEWRDARPLTIACAAIVLIVTWSYHEWVLRADGPEATVTMLIPALIALYAALLAADLVANDRKTGVLTTLSMLPVPLRRLWLAKVTFFTAAVVVFAVWVIDCQVVVLLLGGALVPAGETLERLGEGARVLGPALLVATAILLCSTVGLRSFASVVVGLALAFGARLLMVLFDEGLWLGLGEQETFATMSVAFLLVSLVVFVRGRIHTGARWRPALLGLGVLVPALLAALGVSSVQATAAMDIDPLADETLIQSHYLAPSGEHLALCVAKRDAHTRKPNMRTQRIWVLRTDDGTLHQLPGRMHYSMGWSREGLLHFGQWDRSWFKSPSVQWLEPGPWTHRDSKTGQLVVTGPSFRYIARSPSGTPGLTRLTSQISGLSADLAIRNHQAWGTPDGQTILYPHTDGGIHAHHLLTGTDVEFDTAGKARYARGDDLSDDGAFVMLYSNGAAGLYDVATGVRRTGPWDDRAWRWLRGEPASARIIVDGEDGGPASVYELASSLCVELELSPETEGRVEYLSLPDGAFLALVRKGSFTHTIERLAADGSFERRLFPPER